MILNLFSLPISNESLASSGIDMGAISNVLLPIFERAQWNNVDLEKHGGISTYRVDDALHLRAEFKTLAAMVLQNAKLYWKVLDISDNLEPVIDQCWANLHTRGSYTAPHSHSLMPMVASFYLEAPENSGDIVFTNPMEYSLTHIPYNCTIEDKTETAIHVTSGDLVMFPGWVRHRTRENLSNSRRIVVTFNIKYKGVYLNSLSEYPDISHNGTTSEVDRLTNEIYRQQMIIAQLTKVQR